MSGFARVQELLNKARAGWETKHHRPANLAKHDDGFGWATREQLLQSTAFGLKLISEPDITNRNGANSNLVVALKNGVPPYPRMPIGNPYLADAEIQEIADWINDGALL